MLIFVFVGYVLMALVVRLYSIKWEDDRCIGKDLEENNHGLIGILP
jgi:hypothetical protein